MFGYIIPDKPELKIKEFDLFKAYYCGVCKCIAANYGHVPRFALSYDCTFLGLFLSSIDSDDTKLKLKGCITKPFKKIPVVTEDESISYAAGINIILAYHNILDDIHDRRITAYPAVPLLYPAYKRAKQRYSKQDQSIKAHLTELRKLEEENCDSIDTVAKPFSNLLASIVADGSRQSDNSEVFWELGYNVGKWLYTIDALDDLKQDIKNKSYNPIHTQFLSNQQDEVANMQKVKRDEIKDYVGFILNYSLKQACIAYEALDIKRNKSLLDNIIYGGMYKKTNQILNKKE